MPKRAAGSASASRVSRVVAWSPSSPAIPRTSGSAARGEAKSMAARAEARPRPAPPRSLAPWARSARMPTARTARSAASSVASSWPGMARSSAITVVVPARSAESAAALASASTSAGASLSSTGRRKPCRSARCDPG